MSAPSLHLRVAPGLTRAAVDRALARVPLVVLTADLLAQLAQECGSRDRAYRWLLKLATRRRRPIGVHAGGMTLFVAPAGWTRERLAGYVGAQQDALGQPFGPVVAWEAP
jgi:hypothetical protein